MATKMRLYSYWRSSCSWRVRIALNLKELDYEVVAVNLVQDGGRQFDPQFSRTSPMNVVPVLHVDGLTLIESANIIDYLEETRPQPTLMPTAPEQRARVRTITQIIATGIQPLQNLAVLKKLGENKTEWARHWIHRGFVAVEKLLEEYGGRYCVGDDITVADCFLVPQVYNARRFDVDLSSFPRIVQIDKALADHPAFLDAHPDSQPDCPTAK